MEKVTVRMIDGRHSTMEVCGPAPPFQGQKMIVVNNGEGCFAARLYPDGWVIINEPVKLYPIT